jgi:hypothetical protein
MNLVSSPRFLPAVLWLDAASAAGIGLLQVAAGGMLAAWLGLAPTLLLASGLVLLVFAALAGYSAHARPVWRTGVWVLVAGNLAWVLGCVELLFAGAAATPLGLAYLALQVLAVGALALLEWLGVRRVAAQAWT